MTFSYVYWMLTLTMVFNSIAAQFIITANPDDQMICVGGTAVMNCGFDNGVALTPLARINGTSHASDNPPIAGLPLQFITPNDTNATRIVVGPVGEQFIGTANFSCSFSLRPPVISMTATLTVVGPPSSLTITIDDIRLDSFTISWTVIADVNNVCGPVMYNVTLDNDVTNTTLMTITTSMTNITYDGLNDTTNYTVVVVPYNNAGPGTPANVTVYTLSPSVPFPPTDVQLSLKFVNEEVNINATWMAPQLALNMTDIQDYNLTLTVNSTMFTDTVPANTTEVDIFDIFPDANRMAFTNYSFSVAAVNDLGSSSFTRPVLIVSNYIREASAIPAVENINVSCSVEQSEPPLICSAVFRCADNQATTLNLSSAVVNFMTTQPCDVIIQVVPSNNITRVLQATPFNDVSPLEQPTIPPSTTSTPIPTSTPTSISPTSDDNESDDDDDTGAIIAGVVVGVILIIAIVIVAAILIMLYYRHRRQGSHKPSPLHQTNKSSDEIIKPVELDTRDGSSPSQNSIHSPDPIIPPYSTVQVTNYSENRNGVQVEMSIVSQYSQVSDEKVSTANGDVTESSQEIPQYSIVHKPTKAEGKVDNYTDLAAFGPYPCKTVPAERVEYTDVIPSSDVASHPQYSNVEHRHYTNGSTPHTLSNDQPHYYSAIKD